MLAIKENIKTSSTKIKNACSFFNVFTSVHAPLLYRDKKFFCPFNFVSFLFPVVFAAVSLFLCFLIM